jgi:hypothetical protein
MEDESKAVQSGILPLQRYSSFGPFLQMLVSSVWQLLHFLPGNVPDLREPLGCALACLD